MLEDKISYVYEKKVGNKYVEDYRSEDPLWVYSGLAHCMIAKKIDECTWIRRIVKRQRWDDMATIVVYEDNGNRRIYTIER